MTTSFLINNRNIKMPKILPEGWIPIRCHSRYKPCGYCENEAIDLAHSLPDMPTDENS
jgi:hypothetical protein